MSGPETSSTVDSATKAAVPQASMPLAVLLLACVFAAAGYSTGPMALRILLFLTGAILLFCASYFAVQIAQATVSRRLSLEALDGVITGDDDASYVTDDALKIHLMNAAAMARVDRRHIQQLPAAFGDLFAHPEAALGSLLLRCRARGAATEDVVTRRGHLRLGVRQSTADLYLWSLTRLSERVGADRAANVISLPMMTAGPSGTILFMNDALRSIVGGRVKTLDDVFLDADVAPGKLNRIEGQEGPIDCVVAEVPSTGGRRELYILPATGAVATVRGTEWDAIEDLPVPLLKLSVGGDVLDANREARQLLPMEITPSTRLSDLLEGLGRPVVDWLAEAAEGRGVPGPQFLRGTGEHQDTFVQVTLNLAGDGADRHLLAVLNDATELKSLEAQFVQSQKMQAIGQLAGGVAHDFNNLLTAISGHCDLLLLRHDQGDTDYADLIQIHQNANRAASLVGQLLAFSRKQNLMPEVIDLRDTLSDLTHLLNRLVGEKVTLTLNHDPVLRHIRADKRQLEQVLMNLVVNARDAMPDGGEIMVETENVVLTEPLERDRATVPPGEYCRLRVIDRGTGILPEKLPKIFEPFYTSKRQGEGTGLGLSTAYGIVKQTGGFIFADTVLGEGSTFTLYFPSHDKPAAQAAPAPEVVEDAPAAPSDAVVLLVEDEAPVRAFASRALRMRGYEVLEADSAEAALELLQDPDLAVDIFVTDVIMPGKDGPTWVREALEDRPETRVVFVSGYAEDSFSEHQSLIPNSVFLPKPFSLTELTTTVPRQMA